MDAKQYKPELGQMCFGQPCQTYEVSQLLAAALDAIRARLDIAMWNINQKDYSSPFGNTGNSFVCDVFEVHAYEWNEENEQSFNFKWKDIEVGWYKYLGRGMSVNREVKPEEIAVMLDECLAAIQEYEKKGRRTV